MANNADATEKEEVEAKAAKPSEGKNNKMLFFAIIVVVLLLNTGIAFLLIQATRPKDVAKEEEKKKVDSLVKVEENTTEMGATTGEKPIEVVVNIAGTDGERFLKASVVFEYDDIKYPVLAEELEKRSPKFKSIVMAYMSKLTLVEVTEPDAQERFGKDLLRLINSTLPSEAGEIREVMFTSYIIQ
jgi:flagellar basal body-associated protein FliL